MAGVRSVKSVPSATRRQAPRVSTGSWAAALTIPSSRTTATRMMMPGAMILRRFAVRQELAHAVERLKDVLGRVGVGHAHVPFAENPEVRAADQRDAAIIEQRGRERLRLPAGAFHVRERIKCAL